MTDAMEFAKKSIELVVSPIGIMTILITFGIVLSVARPSSRAGHRLLVLGGLLFLVFLFSPLSLYLTLGLERQFPPLLTPPESPKVNRIAVLAGYAEENPGFPITSNVSEQTMGSMAEGLRLYRLAPGAKLILSGGVVRRGEKPVAAMMADFLQQMGVPAADLIVEGNSQNTYENLFEVRKLVGTHPFILVARACDLRRAVKVAQKLEMNPIPAPACIETLQHHSNAMSVTGQVADFFGIFCSPSLNNLARLQWACHEYLGYLAYRLTGRI
jgi:uncharacterized SAM-binding protein YcdF (DUF218 family)